MKRTRVFHLEDYQIMRDGVKRLLDDDKGIVVVGDASNGPQMLDRIKSIDVDVIILDIYLDSAPGSNGMNGFEVCTALKSLYPHIRVLVHSMYDDVDKIAKLIKAGALGFVSKKSGFAELIHGVKAVADNKFYVCFDTSRRLKNLSNFLSGIEKELLSNDEKFSKREREILQHLSNGESSKEIGKRLCITTRTVETHRKNMIQKVGVKNTVELVAYAGSLGLVKR